MKTNLNRHWRKDRWTKSAARTGSALLLLGRHRPLREGTDLLLGGQRSYLYDRKGTEYLDLQMWYSAPISATATAVECGAEKADRHPAAARLPISARGPGAAGHQARATHRADPRVKGRVHFNVGGASAIEDAMKIVRNHTGKNHSFAFMGGYHGRTLGATSITSSYRYASASAILATRPISSRTRTASAATWTKSPRSANWHACGSSNGCSSPNTTRW